jgi:hypothetical protein
MKHESPHAARDQLFSIVELVSIVLHQADTLTLINCQRVCRQWNTIIKESQELQAHLFKSPTTTPIAAEGDILFNPVLATHFNSLFDFGGSADPWFHGKDAWDSGDLYYHDLSRLPWARDGTHEEAAARQAYARPEASWRNMLITQPPVTRLDWIHDWKYENFERGAGVSHQDYTQAATMGMLWDLVEALLVRGCVARVKFLPRGGDVQEDSYFSIDVKLLAKRPEESHRFPGPNVPRIVVRTLHAWPDNGPQPGYVFDMQTRAWKDSLHLSTSPDVEDSSRNSPSASGDGFRWLMIDCKRDYFLEPSETWRWSKSDASERVEMGTIHRTRWFQ